jgi:hypothetical protein
MVTRAKENSTLNDLTRRVLITRTCESLLSNRKFEREIRRGFPAEQRGHKSNRSIDAKISFYGTYVMLNEQVTLQNQDPKARSIN